MFRLRTRTRSANAIRLRRLVSSSKPSVPSVFETTLSNGVRVISDSSPSHFVALGTYILAGSRYETSDIRGASHFMDRMAFKSTQTRNRDSMLDSLEQFGGHYSCTSSRETMMYQSLVFPEAVEKTAHLIAETIREPKFLDEEIDETRNSIRYELSELEQRPEHFLPELCHITAFQDSGLGNSMFCPEDRIDMIQKPTLQQYISTLYTPSRMVIAFSGLEHDRCVDLAQSLYGDMKPSSAEASVSPSIYSGGLIQIPEDIAPPPLPNHPDLSHLLIGFPSYPIGHPDSYAAATLQHLLGGGGSFSAGGPGKGMYSRFYTSVLNNYGFMESCLASYFNYSDQGLFVVSASCVPAYASHIANILCAQLDGTNWNKPRKSFPDNELERAKSLLRASLMYNLESKVAYIEDLAKQVLFNHRETPEELCRKIEQVSAEDVCRVSRKIFSGKVYNHDNDSKSPTVVMQGNVSEIGNVFNTCDSFGLGAL